MNSRDSNRHNPPQSTHGQHLNHWEYRSRSELRQAGTSEVLKFSVADSEYIYSKDGGPSQWYSVEVWGKSAERLAERLAKGTKVTVYGQLVQRPYTSKAGKEGVAMEVKDGRVSI